MYIFFVFFWISREAAWCLKCGVLELPQLSSAEGRPKLQAANCPKASGRHSTSHSLCYIAYLTLHSGVSRRGLCWLRTVLVVFGYTNIFNVHAHQCVLERAVRPLC